MKVYVFGNPDILQDKEALIVAQKLKAHVTNRGYKSMDSSFSKIRKETNINFITVKPNEDLSFANEKNVIIMDVIKGIDEIKILDFEDIGLLKLSPRTSTHDFDLGLQLKYLKKLGKLKEIKIIGLPYGKKVNYLTIQSILRKLVAQDMQGS